MNEDIIRILDNAEAKMYSVKLERDIIQHCGLTDIIETLYKMNRKKTLFMLVICAKIWCYNRFTKRRRKIYEAGRLHNIGKIALDVHSFKR